jgi:hypothetical protein
MYIATRSLKVARGTILAGEEVPGAALFNYGVLKANLDMGWIIKVDDPKPKPVVETVVTQLTKPTAHKRGRK